ncbi:hypothetical protein PHYSODRAFT_288497 [Phytophthora sojae]|uniref:RxLR effector protein n=2 Tax=Phytophthora sojae TaxID=67593 RepID=G5A539_PHYSP|nr:hypothetical protein PHYSODRAFT_288497 [Phytophthora sojae]EGZ09788.1 hypothetical protein PHYSODRAFT_288497 [Phytophthora sojae]|eukprot:XP_009534649.1 hypothetical protein PHYSODRAFT_288497 [Phytophthora sojae]
MLVVVVVYFAAVEALRKPSSSKVTVAAYNSVGEARRLLRSRESAALGDNNDSGRNPEERSTDAKWVSMLAQLDQPTGWIQKWEKWDLNLAVKLWIKIN